MGAMRHDAVVVTTGSWRIGGLPDMDAFRDSLQPKFRHLVIGPIRSAVNEYVSYAFLPDGSKQGWSTSDEADEARDRFKDLFRTASDDGSSADQWVHISYADDYAEPGTADLVEVHPRHGAA